MPIIVDGGGNPGAGLLLSAIWLNVAANPAELREFPFVSAYSFNPSVNGETRLGASGRSRAFSRAGRPADASVTFDQCTRDDIDWLEDHLGVVLCVRDDRGRRWFGVYREVPTDESVDFDWAETVSLKISKVTYSEAV